MSSKKYINVNNKYDRVIALVDMDCFYCQVEEKLNPDIRGKPIAVVQYNPWQGGGIIAVNYLARAKGVTRHMRGDEARKRCHDIVLSQVPQLRGKADISKYRDAGKDVAAVLQTFTPLLERASVDEAYLDITDRVLARLRDMNDGNFQLLPDKLTNTFAVGYDSIAEFVHKISDDLNENNDAQDLVSNEDRIASKKSDIKLLIGASIVNEIRQAVKEKTGYECSAGIAHNKILAKLTAGFHKPNKQTILPLKSILGMYATLPIKKVKGLGGKLGDQVCEVLNIQFMSELANFSEQTLQSHFDDRLGLWMYNIARGIDLEAVSPKLNSKSIGCCKKFPGKNAITGLATLKHWLEELSNEIHERLMKDYVENKRIAKQMTVSYTQKLGENDVSSTRSVPLVSYEAEKIVFDALDAIKRNTDIFIKKDSVTVLNNPIKFLGISAGKFEKHLETKNILKQMFYACSSKSKFELPKEITKPVENQMQTIIHKADISKSFTTPLNVSSLNEYGSTKAENELESLSLPLNQNVDTTTNTNNNTGIQISLPEDSLFTKTHTVSMDIQESAILGRNEDNLKNIQTIKKSPLLHSQKDKPIDTVAIQANSTVTAESVVQIEECPSELDYRETYAEFARPTISAVIKKTKCLRCGKEIPQNQMQSHSDFHLAIQLSLKQREEFRNTIKQKFSSPVTKSSKPSIQKFLMVNKTGSASGDESCRCEECGKLIPKSNMQQHLDYHTAKKLQLQLNQLEMKTAASNRISLDGLSCKRKRSLSEDKPKFKNLASYFTKM